MEWNELAGAVKKYAPVLGSVVGNFVPGAGALGTGISLIASAFGVEDENPKPEQLYKAIQADPDAAIKLRRIETENQQALANIALKQEEIRLQDVGSARQRQIEHEKNTGKSDKNLYALAWLGILGYLGLIIYIIHWGLPDMTPAVALMVGNLIGIVGSKYSGIYDYFFGTSKSSAEKTKLLGSQPLAKG